MNRSFLAFVVSSLIALSAARAAGPAAGDNPVKASLISDASHVRAGRPFTIGVLLEIDPGWHVYWTNPGDSGAPTVVKFNAPEGFVITPDPFPIPRAFRQGKETTYGYDREALFTARVTPSMDIRIGMPVTFEASINWLACKEACIPGKASLALAMKAEDHTGPANVEDFKRYATTVAAKSARPADVGSIQRKVDAATHVETLTVHWKNPVTSIQLFPGADEAVTVNHIVVKKTENDATDITMKIDMASDQKPASNFLPVLLVWRDSGGHMLGWETDVQVK
ncbi:MAG TPA: protein-disulfide reductase DsbD domain-containing protein [Tepidisphaeraceae bacterium]|jgi:thiol:disulfide interchange protein DsbD|nr:protein-disulfide reductase DsbD domain-containing protein [Tepidisphaeraceae bacterium]